MCQDNHRSVASTGFQSRLSGLVEQLGTAYHVFMPKLVKRYARTRLYDTECCGFDAVSLERHQFRRHRCRNG